MKIFMYNVCIYVILIYFCRDQLKVSVVSLFQNMFFSLASYLPEMIGLTLHSEVCVPFNTLL